MYHQIWLNVFFFCVIRSPILFCGACTFSLFTQSIMRRIGFLFCRVDCVFTSVSIFGYSDKQLNARQLVSYTQHLRIRQAPVTRPSMRSLMVCFASTRIPYHCCVNKNNGNTVKLQHRRLRQGWVFRRIFIHIRWIAIVYRILDTTRIHPSPFSPSHTIHTRIHLDC